MALHEVPIYRLLKEELLPNLIRLDLSFNFIKEIPLEIYSCSNLTELWLQNNPIEEIPVGISELRHLEVLDIAHTKISILPNDRVE